MRRSSLFLRRLALGVSLLLALSTGWLFGNESLQYRSVTRSVNGQNTPIGIAQSPISSKLDNDSNGDVMVQHASSSIHSTLFQLTAGLRPGRGETIPAAQDVHALPVVDISFYNWRGELLSGWLAISTPQAPVIILAHGTPGNRVSMVQRAAFLYKHGYNVLLFDFQSYGRSQGVMSTLGMVESEDILASITYLKSLPATMYSKIGVLGLSMGATAGVLASARSNDIAALVADSCPVDATRVQSDVPNDEARTADQELVQEVYGVDITQARPIDVVSKLAGHTAIFFINGDSDSTTPLSGMQSLYQAASTPKQDWIVPGADHAQAFDIDPEGYTAQVDAFFDATFAHL